QVPLPLQVSGLVHSVSAGLPQAVPAGLKPLSVQLPVPLQVSWLTHAVPASPQEVPAGSSLARQVPLPLQVSGLVHSVSAGLPQARSGEWRVGSALRAGRWQEPRGMRAVYAARPPAR